jgi:hypothetical protein
MPQVQVQDDDDVILVEFEDEAGLRSVSNDPDELLNKSKAAIERSMKTIETMAKKAIETIKAIPVSERPSTFQFQFGIKMNGEAGAVVAKVGAEAAITVTMTWDHKSKSK